MLRVHSETQQFKANSIVSILLFSYVVCILGDFSLTHSGKGTYPPCEPTHCCFLPFINRQWKTKVDTYLLDFSGWGGNACNIAYLADKGQLFLIPYPLIYILQIFFIRWLLLRTKVWRCTLQHCVSLLGSILNRAFFHHLIIQYC